MAALRYLFRRIRALFRTEQVHAEIEAELDFHIDMRTEENVALGMAPDQARREAERQFGRLSSIKEQGYDVRGARWLGTLWQDLRYGFRMLVQRPAFTAVAVATLGLGIGANTAIFSVINTLLLRPLPVQNPEQLVSLNDTQEGRSSTAFSYPNYKDFRDRSDAVCGLIAYQLSPLSLSHDGVNERLWGYLVSGNYFEVLGVRAALGRVISAQDDQKAGAHPVAVVSYKCWRERFGGDQSIIGKDVIVNGRGYSVIGVAQQNFDGTEIIAQPEMWFPMAMQAQIDAGNAWLDDRESEYIFVQARLKAGISPAQATAALNSIALQLETEYPNVNKGKRVALAPPGVMLGFMRGPVMSFTGMLMVVVGLVLVLACTNLANLLLARSSQRRREIAVRLALGASRWRVVRQLLTENMLLALAGGALGVVLAIRLVTLVAALRPPVDVPVSLNLFIDSRVLIFSFAVSVITGLLFGLLPALQATKTDVLSGLKDETSQGGYRASWLKNGLIVSQVALSLLLLIGGGLTLRALQQAQKIDVGFDPQNAIDVSFDLQLQGYDAVRAREFEKRLLERVRGLPGVRSAGIADSVPVDLHFSRGSVFIEGQPPQRVSDAPRAMASRVSPGYFEAMNTRLISGRDFTQQDDDKAPRVAIVNETFAQRFWPDDDPIGKRFSSGGAASPKMQVIGVVQDGKYAGLSEDPKPFFCRPRLQSFAALSSLVVRTGFDPQSSIAAVRSELQLLDPQLPISTAKTLVEHMSVAFLPARLAAAALGGFGLLALALAAIGIYGVMSCAVSRRAHEIGVRTALGAQRSDVLRLVIGQGMTLTLLGVVIGLSAAFASTRLIKSLLFGVSATDTLTYLGVAVLLASVALLACYIPARRATKVDPMVALRYE
jgi:macrolide transport system ATP-binding/permease protein